MSPMPTDRLAVSHHPVVDPATDPYVVDVVGGSYRLLVLRAALGGNYRIRSEVLA